MSKSFFNIRSGKYYYPLQLVSDFIAIMLSYFVHVFIRFKTGLFGNMVNIDFTLLISSLIVFEVYWIGIFLFSGLYKNWFIRSPFDELFTILRVNSIGSFLIFFFVLLDSSTISPRLLFIIFFLVLSTFTISGRFIVRRLQKKLKVKKFISIPSIIIGTYSKVNELFDQIKSSPEWGYQVVGCVVLDKETPELDDNACNYYIGTDGFKQVISEKKIEEVLITSDDVNHTKLLEIVATCSECGISVKIEPDLYDFFTGQARTLQLYGIPLIEINTQILQPWEYFIKRFVDITFSFIVLILVFPLLIIIGIIIKLESKGPIFYRQNRVGRNGKVFYIYKLRSMFTDAEKDGPKWAIQNDPRVTRIGRILRKFHIDEIPQFFNAIQGHMSLVGPRPERPFFVDKFCKIVPFYNRRHVVRPGITGLWQIKYSVYVESKEDIERRLKYDFYYIENWSLKLDIEIILRTVLLVFKGHGQT